MITDEQVELAIDALLKQANKAAEARAHAEHLDDMRSVRLAQIASKQEGKSEAEKERHAKADPEYEEFLLGLKVAREKDHTFRNKRAAALALIDAWRSMSANRRGVDRVG